MNEPGYRKSMLSSWGLDYSLFTSLNLTTSSILTPETKSAAVSANLHHLASTPIPKNLQESASTMYSRQNFPVTDLSVSTCKNM